VVLMSRKKKRKSYTHGEEVTITFVTDIGTLDALQGYASENDEAFDENLHNRLNATITITNQIEKIEKTIHSKLTFNERVRLQLSLLEKENRRLIGDEDEDIFLLDLLSLSTTQLTQLNDLRRPSGRSISEFFKIVISVLHSGNNLKGKVEKLHGRKLSSLEFMGLIESLMKQHIAQQQKEEK
jgi:hypothetical protein